jgi:hypothetical protein
VLGDAWPQEADACFWWSGAFAYSPTTKKERRDDHETRGRHCRWIGPARQPGSGLSSQFEPHCYATASVPLGVGFVGESRPIFGERVQIGTIETDEGHRTCQVSYAQDSLIVVELAPGAPDVELHSLFGVVSPAHLAPVVTTNNVVVSSRPNISVPRWRLLFGANDCRVALVLDRLPELRLPAPLGADREGLVAIPAR